MAALALLFAVHTYAPSPFFVLDEVDAALDHANTTQLAQYVKEHAGPGMQFVVISLKTGLFQNSETLVGVMRDQAVNSSRALTLDVSCPEPPFRILHEEMFADFYSSYGSTRPCEMGLKMECNDNGKGARAMAFCFEFCNDPCGLVMAWEK
jgi:energy-coupling factor transporter ATP-binding protein EcfA2